MARGVAPCAKCGRSTRDYTTPASSAPGTVLRTGSMCHSCYRVTKGDTLGVLGIGHARESDEPLTDDEELVMRAIEARYSGAEAAELVATLGLSRELEDA